MATYLLPALEHKDVTKGQPNWMRQVILFARLNKGGHLQVYRLEFKGKDTGIVEAAVKKDRDSEWKVIFYYDHLPYDDFKAVRLEFMKHGAKPVPTANDMLGKVL